MKRWLRESTQTGSTTKKVNLLLAPLGGWLTKEDIESQEPNRRIIRLGPLRHFLLILCPAQHMVCDISL